MKPKVIIFIVLALTSVFLIGAWKIILGPFPSLKYKTIVVPGGIEFSSSSFIISGHEMGTDSIYGYLYDFDRNIFFHLDAFLMAGNYVEFHSKNISTMSKYIDTDKIIVQDIKSDTSNFGIAYQYLITGEIKSHDQSKSLENITLYVTFESLQNYGLFTAPDYLNFVTSLKDRAELENHISFFETAKPAKPR